MKNENNIFHKVFALAFALALFLVPTQTSAYDRSPAVVCAGGSFANCVGGTYWGLSSYTYNHTGGIKYVPATNDTFDTIDLYMDKAGTPSDNTYVQVWNIDTATVVATSDNINGSAIIDASFGNYPTSTADAESLKLTYSFSSSITLTATTNYAIKLRRSGSDDDSNNYNIFKSSSTDSGVSTTCNGPSGSNETLVFCASSGLFRTYLDVLPDGVYPTAPLTGDTSNSPVQFTGVYTNGASYNKIVFNILDTTDSIELNILPFNIPLINGSDLPYSFSIPLTLGHTYEYQTWLLDTSDSSTSTVSDWQSFATDAGVTPTPPLEYEDCDSLDIACYLRNFAIWAFIPDASVLNAFSALKVTFSESFPFAFVSDIANIFDNGAGTPETLPTVNVSVSGLVSSTQIVSQSSIEDSIPSTVWDFLKGLITMSIWLGVCLYVYNKVKSLMIHNS